MLTDLPLERMYAAHCASRALATLAVLPPAPERYLLFDDRGLCGLARRHTGEEELARATAGAVHRFEFAGVHVVSPEIFGLITERGAFSILWTYLRLARDGAAIVPFSAEGARWVDIGTRLGFVVLVASFVAYVSGMLDPHLPPHRLPLLWGLPVDHYVTAASAPTGWAWLGFVARADYLNYVGVALLATVTLAAYARIVPMLLSQRERLRAAIAIAQVVVLVVAALL